MKVIQLGVERTSTHQIITLVNETGKSPETSILSVSSRASKKGIGKEIQDPATMVVFATCDNR